ncbi:ATP-dependent RNA helicase DRS1-like [Tropilaelaps mercedesae]|uniref:ATP-dependent RNA helicase DRS1-like n=1 Tax=Tropilaelaps mercedesae TaxID=418985 RepID=A0A1V9XN94_9ACAR|nr:ATP-dependent RNA helicase DRS1-like [Tropilaelaps mercedesae]
MAPGNSAQLRGPLERRVERRNRFIFCKFTLHFHQTHTKCLPVFPFFDNRLARYIDNMNRLQNENQRLQHTVRRVEEQKMSEITSVKGDFQREIQALRALVDEEGKHKALAQAEADNCAKQKERFAQLNVTLQADFDRASRRVGDLEAENAELKSRLDNSTIQLGQRNKENAQLKKQLEEADRALKTATVDVATLRNKLESLKEDNKFMRETHEKELRQAHTLTEEQITEIDGRAQARADTLLEEKIEEFRQVYEIEKSELRRHFDEELKQRLAGYVPAGEHAQMESRLETLTVQLETTRSDLEEKRRLLDQERAWIGQQLRLKDEQIADANARYRELKKEFDDLIDIKDGLQKELDTYRTLLEQEETRLNISDSSGLSARTPSSILTSGSRKRKRLSQAMESTEGQEEIQCVYQNLGPLKVAEHDVRHGKFVTIENTSDEDISLGGWRISHRSGEVEASHKFPPRSRIKANSKMTLWSSDSGATHNPPSDIVLKNISFPTHDNQSGELEVITALYNHEEKEIAKRISKSQRSSKTTVRTFTQGSRSTPQRVSFAPGEVFHVGGGDEGAALDDSRCAIM